MTPRKIISAFIVLFLTLLAWEIGTPRHAGTYHNTAYGCLGGGVGTTTGVGTGIGTDPFAAAALAGSNGVLVDADGVLRRQAFADPNGQLMRQRIAAARGKLNPNVARASKLRMVSLNRLEAAVRDNIANQAGLSEEMLCLAGLTRLRYVFFYPETKEIVIAGPAEAWVADLSGRLIGMATASPILELQDLIVALRAFPPGAHKQPVILCSIDPTPEGLARMQSFLRSVGTQITPDDTPMIVNGLRTSMGMQDIRVGGIAANTHYAQVLIEADYRMKLIGLGLEQPSVPFRSYVDRATPAQANHNALQRWYFVPEYKCVKVSPDDLGMELVGNGVRLVSEDQVVAQNGSRKATGRSNGASKGFVDDFTRKYPDIAARTPIYAQLRNVIDMAVAAAFIQQKDYFAKAAWRMEAFSDEKTIPVETYNTPLHVETVVNALIKGNHLMTPVGGGVTIQPNQALQSENLLRDDASKVVEVRGGAQLKDLPANQWWWDADVPDAAPVKKKGHAPAPRKAAK